MVFPMNHQKNSQKKSTAWFMPLTESEKNILHRRVVKLMGNRFELTVVNDNESSAQVLIDQAIGEIQRIEDLLTTFKETSQTNQINNQAGIAPVPVDREVF